MTSVVAHPQPLSTPTDAPARADRTPPLTLARASAVEARKLVNSPAGRVLTAVAALLSGVFAGGRALLANSGVDVGTLAAMASLPVVMIVTVMAILLVTSEFSARTASVTLTLDPSRGRLLAAKAIAGTGLAVLATVSSFAAAALVGLVAPAITGHATVWTADAVGLGVLAGSMVFQVLAGMALGLALRNAPAPIVLLLAWPTVTVLVQSVSAAAARLVAHVDVQPLFRLTDGTADPLLPILTSTLVWIVLPAAIGAWRLLRRDV